MKNVIISLAVVAAAVMSVTAHAANSEVCANSAQIGAQAADAVLSDAGINANLVPDRVLAPRVLGFTFKCEQGREDAAKGDMTNLNNAKAALEEFQSRKSLTNADVIELALYMGDVAAYRVGFNSVKAAPAKGDGTVTCDLQQVNAAGKVLKTEKEAAALTFNGRAVTVTVEEYAYDLNKAAPALWSNEDQQSLTVAADKSYSFFEGSSESHTRLFNCK